MCDNLYEDFLIRDIIHVHRRYYVQKTVSLKSFTTFATDNISMPFPLMIFKLFWGYDVAVPLKMITPRSLFSVYNLQAVLEL